MGNYWEAKSQQIEEMLLKNGSVSTYFIRPNPLVVDWGGSRKQSAPFACSFYLPEGIWTF